MIPWASSAVGDVDLLGLRGLLALPDTLSRWKRELLGGVRPLLVDLDLLRSSILLGGGWLPEVEGWSASWSLRSTLFLNDGGARFRFHDLFGKVAPCSLRALIGLFIGF